MKDANFHNSLSPGFILSMVLLSLRSLGNPLRSTCNKSMHPVVFRESEFRLCFWIALLEQWCFASLYLCRFNFHRIKYVMEQRGVCDRLKEIPLQSVKNHV